MKTCFADSDGSCKHTPAKRSLLSVG